MRRGLVSLAALLASALLIPQPVVADDGPAQDRGTRSVNVDEARAWRQMFGLASDSVQLARAESEAVGVDEFGLPLTANEVAELHRRLDRQPAIDALRARLAADVDGFGGLFVDHSAGGVVDVAVTNRVADRTVAAVAATELPVRTRTVDYSMADLRKTQQLVTDISGSLRAEGYPIVSIGVDVRQNRVVVGVESRADQVYRELEAEFGAKTIVEVRAPISAGACNSRSDCTNPLRAGLSISSVVSGTTYYCTSNFVAHQTNSTNIVLLTAGHCGKQSKIGQTWRHNGVSIGTTQGSGFFNQSATDGQWIDISNAQKSNLRYTTNTVTSFESHSNTDPGDTVYKSGISTGVTSGVVEDDYEDIYLEGVLFGSQVRAQVVFNYGDSGAPVYRGGTAIGIASAFDANGNMWFSHIQETMNQLHVVPCLNAACSN